MWLSSKESTCQSRRHRRHRFNLWIRKLLWRKKWQSTPVFLPRESHGQRSLAGYSPWGSQKVRHDWTHTHTCSCSVTKSRPALCDPMDCRMPGSLVLHYLLRVCTNSCPLNQWCYLTISSSAAPFPFYLQSFPASGAFPVSWLFALDGQSIGAAASASVLPMNIQGWFPLVLTDLISLQSKELLRIFSSTTIWKHQFFGAQPSLWSSSHICICVLEKP